MPDIYLDYAAATPVDPRVFEAMRPFFESNFANPSSLHRGGVEARKAIDHAREQVAKLIGARSQEIIFTSGATESINLAILGAARASGATNGHIVALATEHVATLKTLEHEGFELTLVSVDKNGQVEPATVLAAIKESTILVSIMLANNEIGTIAPLAEIGRGLLKLSKRPLFHSDVAQAIGVIPIDVTSLHLDLLSFSGAKIYGPKGSGALYVRSGVKLEPLLSGGNQEHGLKPGTENVPAIVGLGQACEIAKLELKDRAVHLHQVRKAFVQALHESLPTAKLNGDQKSTVPQIVNVTIPGLDGEELVIRLDAAGIACSTASACKSSEHPSHVLRAIGLSEVEIRSTLRFSFGQPTSEREAKLAVQALARFVDQMSR